MKWPTMLNRVIVTAAQVLSGVGALIILQENDVLGIDDTIAAWIILTANVLTVISQSLRANWIPGVTTGVGVE
jgi:hypothetical protein